MAHYEISQANIHLGKCKHVVIIPLAYVYVPSNYVSLYVTVITTVG